MWKRRKAEAEALAFLKRARTGGNSDTSECQEQETKASPFETTNPARKRKEQIEGGGGIKLLRVGKKTKTKSKSKLPQNARHFS